MESAEVLALVGGHVVLPQFAVGELEITHIRSMSYKIFSDR